MRFRESFIPTAMPLTAADLRRRTGLAQVRVYGRLRSTNTTTARLVESNRLAAPAAVIASIQTAGRGRGSHLWHSDAGSLTVTFALRDSADIPTHTLPLLVGLAIRDALARHVAADRLALKWPNDVLADGKKIAGVLCEFVRGYAIVGVGVNVATNFAGATPDVQRRATSLRQLLGSRGKTPTRDEVFIDLAIALRSLSRTPDWVDRFNRAHAFHCRSMSVDTGDGIVNGVCRGLDDEGRLLLESAGRTTAVIAGTVLPTA